MISILTTVKNGHEFLEECARSIFLQRCEYGDLRLEWEWWIGINGWGISGGVALEEAMRIKAAWPQYKIHVVNLSDADGRVAALNQLSRMATGEWIAILDCDDLWEPDKLITQIIAVHISERKIDVIGTFCTYFGASARGVALPSGWISPESVYAFNPIINSSVLIRKELAAWEDRYNLEDYDLWIRLARAGHSLFNVPHSLVRHRLHQGSAFNASGSQNLDGLRRWYGIGRPTVVSAYYPIKSKYDITIYLQWIAGFWPKISCPLIFYTEPTLVETFKHVFGSRKDTEIIGLSFSSLAAFRKLSYKAWKETQQLDKEAGHSPELYAIWYEKKEFVLRSMERNPFSSDRFVWCDAGICRYPAWLDKLGQFPLRELIPQGRMLVLEIDPLRQQDCSVVGGIPGRFDGVATFGGGILASDTHGWIQWSKAYDAMLIRYHLAGRFIGKDQNIMASMILESPEIAAVVKRPEGLGPIAGWFYLLLFLAHPALALLAQKDQTTLLIQKDPKEQKDPKQ